jgi:hypothetical protein
LEKERLYEGNEMKGKKRQTDIDGLGDMRRQAEAYFSSCDEDDSERPYTMAGVALARGFGSLEDMYELGKNKRAETSEVVSWAILRVIEYAETRLYDREGVNDAKFLLANYYGKTEDDKSYSILLGEIEGYCE